MILAWAILSAVVAAEAGTTRPQSRPATEPAADLTATAANGPAALPATRPARAAIRPMLTDQEYRDLAASLRADYSKPPAQWPRPTIDPGGEFEELATAPEPAFPEDNPYTKAKAELGRRLFFEPRISASGQFACASCHDPDLGWADGRTVAFGHERQALGGNGRVSPTSAPGYRLFWDGRATTLEQQAKEVLLNPREMRGGGEREIVEHIAADKTYRERFRAAFGSDDVTLDRLAQSVATFERTIVGGRSRFDLFLHGRRDALSDEAVRGLHLFRTAARCANCHYGPTFSDGKFHDLGLSYYGRKLQDLGRYNVTHDPADVGAFKTPTLRNVGRTAPYMHLGLFDMDGVLALYNAGMPTLRRKESQRDDPLFPTKSALLKPLGLNRHELADLHAFLDALSEPRRRVRPPQEQPSSDEAPPRTPCRPPRDSPTAAANSRQPSGSIRHSFGST